MKQKPVVIATSLGRPYMWRIPVRHLKADKVRRLAVHSENVEKKLAVQ